MRNSILESETFARETAEDDRPRQPSDVNAASPPGHAGGDGERDRNAELDCYTGPKGTAGNGGAHCHSRTCVETACSDGVDNDSDQSADRADKGDCRRSGLEWCVSDTQCYSGLSSSCTCSTWSSSTAQGGVGQSGGTQAGWFQAGSVQCTLGEVRLYCIDGQ